jgi:transposase
MSVQTFGVDISARWFDMAHAEQVRRFANTSAGITACLTWLATFGTRVRVGMEATGSYHLPLATALHAAGHLVLVCTPLSIARYRQAVLARTKTDAADARRIARFCEAHQQAVTALDDILARAVAFLDDAVDRRRNQECPAGEDEAVAVELAAVGLHAAQVGLIDPVVLACVAIERERDGR